MLRRLLNVSVVALLAAFAAPAVLASEGGAASPKEAATGFLTAWKAKDHAGFKSFVREADRDEAVLLLDCTEIEEFAVGDITEAEGRTEANYTWKVKLDGAKFTEILCEQARKQGEKSGASKEEIDQQVAMLQSMLPMMLPMFKEHFEKEKHQMTLVKDGERWFVDEPLEQPEDDAGK